MSLDSSLARLVRFKTITGDHAEVERAFAWIREQLADVPLHVRTHSYGGFTSLVATTKRTKKPKLWLAAHVDVVPGGAHMFRPRVANGRMFGRGTCDMKFAIASYLELLRGLGRDAAQYDLGLMFTSDEEIGGFNGTKLLLKRAGYSGDLVFLPDGGGPWNFEECAKGKMVARAYTEGVSAHGSRPWLGRNAIMELSAALIELTTWADARGAARDDKWYTTIAVTEFRGGEATNSIPEFAEAMLDIRPTSDKEVIAVERKFAALVRTYPNTRFETLHAESCCGLPRTNEYAKIFARLAHEKHGITCGWARAHGASDARHFACHSMPCLLVVPHSGSSHSEEEWVDLADFARFHEVLKLFVEEVARDAK